MRRKKAWLFRHASTLLDCSTPKVPSLVLAANADLSTNQERSSLQPGNAVAVRFRLECTPRDSRPQRTMDCGAISTEEDESSFRSSSSMRPTLRTEWQE